MSDPQALQPGSGSRMSSRTKDDWEDWEDDEVLTPMTTRDGPLLDAAPGRAGGARGEAAGHPERRPSRRVSGVTARPSMKGLGRFTSRRRQKAQNVKAGITLVTDMTKFQKQKQQHIAHHMKPTHDNRESRTGKFVDAAALKALEGAPSDDSIGTFAWLTRRPTKGKRIERLVAESSPQADLSPGARPIMIGFEMPSDSDVVISPQTAVVETPIEFPLVFKPTNVTSPSQPVSAWSPDTEDGASPRMVERGFVPAVPSIPSHYRAADVSPITASDHGDAFSAAGERRNFRDTATTPIYVSDNDDDMATPVTLFEEDGSPATTQRKSLRFKGRPRSGTGGSARSKGWWDQVTSPFGPPTPRSPASIQTKPDEGQSWWNDLDKKKAFSPATPMSEAGSSSGSRNIPRTHHHQPPEIIIEDMSSSIPSSSRTAAAPPQRQPERQPEPEKRREMVEEVQTPGEQPPPYSPPSRNNNARYRAVFPPGHPLNSLYPPSPGPVPPGLSQTMTSQGAIDLSDVPLTPPPTDQRLPDRPLGSFVPGDHFIDVSGRGPRQKAERQRRRHEKEDAVAFQAGRMWHGRGCFPCCGCFGRPGREGRKRRRWCLGICIAILLLTALGVTLGILLTRQTAPEEIIPSRFLNLTNFPPIPTGISTVIGPESDSTTACVQPPTLWTCALPKEQADSVAPFDASQPSFVIQIQFDNNTRQLWNVQGDPPRPTPTDRGESLPLPQPIETTTAATATPTTSPRAVPVTGFTSLVRHLLRKRDDSGSSLALRSEPPPPSFQEIFFLGNTTDGVVSDDKAGEPTPFYISMLRSTNDTVGPNTLTRRADDDDNDNNNGINFNPQTNITAGQALINASDIAPPPALDRDGTGAPAVLLAFPTQQPLRLYDRGLPTERYGFYSYFNKTTYVKSAAALGDDGDDDETPVPADLNGGALKTEAKFLVTWLSVRYKVEIWTRMANTTRLVGDRGVSGSNSTQPGSFPYPVTVTMDTHGGERGRKFAFLRGVDDRQRIILDDALFVLNRMNTTGDLINAAGGFNPSFGGMDGGTGGCKCEYRNWLSWATVRANRKAIHTRVRNNEERGVVTLAIETSCDDTCVAVLQKSGDAAKVLFNSKATSDHRKFGGIKPDEAVQGHSANLPRLLQAAIQQLPIDHPKPDFVSVTRGPGITSALSVGLTMAKGLALVWERPLVAVHHMQAHALTPRLVEALANSKRPPPEDSAPRDAQPAFPFLSLLVSGGHTQLLLTRSAVSHATLAEAANVAIGDMLDKCARAILPAHILANTPDVMYAAELERFAFPKQPPQQQPQQPQTHPPPPPPPTPNNAPPPPPPNLDPDLNPDQTLYTYHPPTRRRDEIQPYTSPTHGWTLTPPLHESRAMAFDFSGLGGQVQAIVQRNPGMDEAQRVELARETMRVAFEHLASRVVFVLDGMRAGVEGGVGKGEKKAVLPVKTLVVSGGVASNRFLMYVLQRVLEVRGYGRDVVGIVRPPRELCTDNAVMVAWAGMEMWEAGWQSDLSVLPQRRWPMDDGYEGIEDPEAERVERYRWLEVQRERGEPRELGARMRAAESHVSKKHGILGVDGWQRRSRDKEILWLAEGAKANERARQKAIEVEMRKAELRERKLGREMPSKDHEE
ncbi:glycoprotease family-domain-containing protein [Chaetomium fimeti]|uniref:N(6)-L-threonylcarbamoyladenine synthase n=1 Tax=Chaetomium fimeti TaxID=1854472 RepID=A0AAE0LXK4_9PEZI|nr:glycoprotease family-domain-containing protein [Chaetomium fimeti]